MITAAPKQSKRAAKAERFFAVGGDLFCGCGGGTEGAKEAWEEIGQELGVEIDLNMVAVNHWDVAIKTHSANHPGYKHHRENLDTVDPRQIVPSRHLLFLWASPECTNHSYAAGGRPKNDQSRATAWCVVRWAEALDIKNIMIENVVEFRDWGPLYTDCICGLGIEVAPDKHPKECHYMKPIPEKKGKFYRSWLRTFKDLGYTISERVLCAADFGDATTRKRLFIQMRKDGRRPIWPEVTHHLVI
jgi:DNA (cytosine-5)-methyltransferase 1